MANAKAGHERTKFRIERSLMAYILQHPIGEIYSESSFALSPSRVCAAAQVEHFGIGLHDLADNRVIAASQQFADESRLHCAFSNVLARKPRTRSVCSTTSTRKESCPQLAFRSTDAPA